MKRELTPRDAHKRKVMLEAIKAIKRGGDYSDHLNAAFDIHESDPVIGQPFWKLADRAIELNMLPFLLVQEGRVEVNPKVTEDTVKELSKLYKRLDMALVVANLWAAGKTIQKIERVQETLLLRKVGPTRRAPG
ncbi:MAG: hypothetical protein KGH94_04110 [Candidatus Micrarchaeota archaeon]|nr:hypothetical protein [Candidatus Micrarchaeota archaeon]